MGSGRHKNNSNLAFIAGIFAVVVISLQLIEREKPRSRQSLDALSAVVKAKEEQITLIEDEAVLPQVQESQDRKALLQEFHANVSRLPLQKRKGSLDISLRFVPEKRNCSLGDLDFIKLNQSHHPNASLTLSLEPLLGAGGSYQAVAISADKLFQSQTQTLTVSNQPQLFGLFLCSNQDAGPCQGRPVANFDAILQQEYRLSSGHDLTVTTPDESIFYFQLLAIKDGNLTFVSESGENDEAFDHIETTFKRTQFSRQLRQSMGRFKDLQTKLASVPPQISDGEIVLSLPYGDPDCGVIASH